MRLKNKKTIHNPHDKALFQALQNRDVARDAIRAYLDDSLLALTDLTNIRPYKTKLVTPEFKEFEADIIYEIKIRGERALFLFHCENQSTVEKFMPLRIWQYILLLLMEYAKAHPKKPLPIIYPVVIYTGEEPYTESMDFFDLFGQYNALAKQHMLSAVKLVDVCRMADEDIRKHRLFGLSEHVFKHKKTKQFEKVLAEMLPWAHEVELELHKDYVIMLIRYMVDVYPDADYETLATGIKRYLSEDLGNEAMTIAQQLKQQGMQQEKHAIASNLLREHIDIAVIAKTTHLSMEELKKLKKEIEDKKH